MTVKLKILTKSILVNLVFVKLKILPHPEQKLPACLELQVGQGGVVLGFFTNFSVVTKRIRVPININTVAPNAWNTCNANSSPYALPIAKMVVIRIMFKAMIRGMPKASIAPLFQSFPRVIYAMKTAKITKPIRL